jgi:hypothetical protein
MIEYMNKKYPESYKLVYSTPSKYVDALKKYNVSWPTKYDDMMPYSDGPDGYWTGYFSSRANDKEYIRRASHNFHASMQIYSERLLSANEDARNEYRISEAKAIMMDALGINQHHDAVTGTAKQRVADDYALRLYKALEANNQLYNMLLGEKVEAATGVVALSTWSQCFRTNSTYLDCPVSEHSSEKNLTMWAAVHNPASISTLSQRFAVPSGTYSAQVFDIDV